MNIVIEETVFSPILNIEETVTNVVIEVSEMQVPGERGVQGEQGLTGIQGVKGDTGERGLQGLKGDTGDTGAQGIQGLKGDTGLQGIQGIQGLQGVKGDTGANGLVDYTGIVKNIAKDAIQGANITGTVSETILYSKLISANTFKDGDFMNLFSRIARPSPTASSGGVDHRIRVNTSNTLTGSIIIAKNLLTAGVNGNQVVTLERTFNVTNGYLIGTTTAFNANTDILNSNNAPQLNVFNPAVDNYIFVTGQLGFSGDTMYHLGTKITN